MADWRDSLLEGSIDGIPMFVSSVATSIGRRTTSTSLPFRDSPSYEDLGRKARKFDVQAVVIGLDYIQQRDDLIKVFERSGPYLFTHPWQGELSVILDGGSAVNITESHSEGGWARISFTLVESGDPDGAKITISTSAALSAASAAAREAVQVDTQKKLKLGLGNVFSAAAKAVGKISGSMLKAKRKVFGALGVSQAAGLSDSLADLNTSVNKLLNSPAELLTTLNGLVAALKGFFKDQSAADSDSPNAPYPGGAKKVRAEAAIAMAQDLAAIDTVTPPPFPGGPQDADEVAAEKALSKAVGVMVVSQVIDLFGSSLPLESASAAVGALSTLGDLADQILIDTDSSDDLFTAMTDLRAALDNHLASLSASLPAVQTFIPAATTPALLVAFNLYGDPTRDLEICGRNGVRDPNFLPGGEPLEVLINA